MKKNNCKWIGEVLFSVMTFLTIIGALPASGEISLSTSESVSSAPVVNSGVSDKTPAISRSGAKLAGNNATTIDVVNFFGPARNMAGAETVHRKLIDDYLIGKFNKSSGYIVIEDDKIPWTALCYAEGNPTKWLVLQQLIVVKGDAVSISQISVRQISSVNILDDNYVVGSRGYGPAAIGIKSDGTKIESGSGNQTANTVLFITQMKMFNMGDTHDGQTTVRTYLLGQKKQLSLTISASHGVSAVTTTSVFVIMPRLSLNITEDQSFQKVVKISIVGDAPDFGYDLYQSLDPQGPWIGIGEIRSIVGVETKRELTHHQFFKVLPQP